MLVIILSVVVIFCIWSSADIRSRIYIRCVCKGSRKDNAVALTFDDGPDPVNTPKILDILRKNNIKATFFIIGSKAEVCPDIVKQIHDDGHLIGNHTYSHSGFYTLWTSNKIYEDIKKANNIVFKIIGRHPLFFRPPFGVTNPLIRNAVKGRFKCIGWSIRSFDTISFLKRNKISKRIAYNLRNGDIILLHDDREQSDQLLNLIIEIINKKGMKVIPLDKLINVDAYEI